MPLTRSVIGKAGRAHGCSAEPLRNCIREKSSLHGQQQLGSRNPSPPGLPESHSQFIRRARAGGRDRKSFTRLMQGQTGHRLPKERGRLLRPSQTLAPSCPQALWLLQGTGAAGVAMSPTQVQAAALTWRWCEAPAWDP